MHSMPLIGCSMTAQQQLVAFKTLDASPLGQFKSYLLLN
jgi:hypothetical protein